MRVVFSNMTGSYLNERPDVFALNSMGDTVLIEVKVSLADFMQDAKKTFRTKAGKGMGDYRYYCVPCGLVSLADIPQGWGLIEYKNGSFKTVLGGKPGTYNKKRFKKDSRSEARLFYQVLTRVGHVMDLQNFADAGVFKTENSKYLINSNGKQQ
jgi:hypothetical protein